MQEELRDYLGNRCHSFHREAARPAQPRAVERPACIAIGIYYTLRYVFGLFS